MHIVVNDSKMFCGCQICHVCALFANQLCQGILDLFDLDIDLRILELGRVDDDFVGCFTLSLRPFSYSDTINVAEAPFVINDDVFRPAQLFSTSTRLNLLRCLDFVRSSGLLELEIQRLRPLI